MGGKCGSDPGTNYFKWDDGTPLYPYKDYNDYMSREIGVTPASFSYSSGGGGRNRTWGPYKISCLGHADPSSPLILLGRDQNDPLHLSPLLTLTPPPPRYLKLDPPGKALISTVWGFLIHKHVHEKFDAISEGGCSHDRMDG